MFELKISSKRNYLIPNQGMLNSTIQTVQILMLIRVFKNLLRALRIIRTRNRISKPKLMLKRIVGPNQLLSIPICFWEIRIKIGWFKYKIKIGSINFLLRRILLKILINSVKFLGEIKSNLTQIWLMKHQNWVTTKAQRIIFMQIKITYKM